MSLLFGDFGEKNDLSLQLLNHDVFHVFIVKVSEVHQTLSHAAVQGDCVSVLLELSDDLSLIVFDNQYLNSHKNQNAMRERRKRTKDKKFRIIPLNCKRFQDPRLIFSYFSPLFLLFLALYLDTAPIHQNERVRVWRRGPALDVLKKKLCVFDAA